MMRIATHSGPFHADEALAVALLKTLPEFREAEVVRTRDLAVVAACDVAVDVGGEFDHARRRYDHHQRNFSYTLSGLTRETRFGTKLSSAGLVYAFYGKKVIAQILETGDKKQIDKVFEKV